jgi:acetyltransferase-like isoleucine patch superfamily enzyme
MHQLSNFGVRRFMGKVISALLRLPADIWQMIITYFPGPIGNLARYRFWKKRLMFLGEKVKIDVGVYFQNPQFISIDDHCWIDRGVIILAGPDRSSRAKRLVPNDKFPFEKGRVHIGKNVHIALYVLISGIGGVCISDDCGISSGVKIYSFSHHYRSDEFPSDRSFCFNPLVEHNRQYMIEGPVFLGRSVGVALNAIILPGVFIAPDSFIAINSVVLSSCEEDNSLIAGNPAKRVKERFKL